MLAKTLVCKLSSCFTTSIMKNVKKNKINVFSRIFCKIQSSFFDKLYKTVNSVLIFLNEILQNDAHFLKNFWYISNKKHIFVIIRKEGFNNSEVQHLAHELQLKVKISFTFLKQSNYEPKCIDLPSINFINMLIVLVSVAVIFIHIKFCLHRKQSVCTFSRRDTFEDSPQ